MSATAVFRGTVPSAEVVAELLEEAGVSFGILHSVLEEIAGREAAQRNH